jgi:hypothetical protein
MHLLLHNNNNLCLVHKTSQNDRLQHPFTQTIPDYKAHRQTVPLYSTEDPQVNINMIIKQIYGNTGYTAIFIERLDCNEKQWYAPHKQLIIRIYLRQKKYMGLDNFIHVYEGQASLFTS